MSKRKIFIRLFVIAGGIGIVLFSIFASQLGLDNDPGWGPRRIQMIWAGLTIILFGALYWITLAVSRWYKKTLKPRMEGSSIKNIFENAPARDNKPVSNQHSNLWLILIGSAVLCFYVWIITAGQIEKWPSGRDYYWLLAQAFRQGQTHLLVEPNPELLSLENPYDRRQRIGVDYLWDISVYDGKYYLYWGPVPAVAGVIVSSITSRPVTDAGLVFSFVAGIALFSILLLRKMYQDNRIPAWAFWGGMLASAFNIPLIWLLTRPAFYEVSISGGQMFLMAGFYFLYLAFRSSEPHKVYTALSALSFGLAGGTRVNLLPSVVFLAFVILHRIYIANKRKIPASISAFAAAIIPLAIIACLLAWYNHVRFGSVFEFGHRYQLTGPALTTDYSDISSAAYILPNLYTYVFRLPSLNGEFPFLTVPWVKENMWPFFIRLPQHYYYTEPVAGILFIVPLIGLTALLLARWFWLFINGDVSLTGNIDELLSRFGFPLLGYIFIQFFILLIFVNSAMRYLLDVSPALIVLSAIFAGYYAQSIEKESFMVKMISYAWALASILTVVSGFIIGLTGDKNHFLNKNPQLYYQLLEWFSR